MEYLLQLRNVVFQRDNFTLRVDTLDLQAGKRYLLTGPNGAGKSTLLQLLAQLLVPQQGELWFAGEPVTGPRQRRKLRHQITLVEQSPFLFNGTVYQNLAFGLRLRDVKGDLQRRRIERALAAVGLEDFESRHSDNLSGGEIQRVALARALVLRPRLLLLDEAGAGLDTEALPMFEQLVTDLSEKGVTVVLASHDQQQPRRLKATILPLCDGILAGPPGEKEDREDVPLPLKARA
ncbi:ABC transporter ATP-binding protein [Geothermobacter hydrogeniphilus]|uniref:ABC transporter ATP-binding protein n=1 Tax=Geothermobacter hydrogeniphilus TaxID=1969733 RepID=A0A2K2HDA2_9BACT|nr:ATP-binding cassette domain-containing protein [Geothermobacter hydrogeniphilus]PNU21275.1 ABC transporter ATP-binding protein [Geothermobacter hydrogeniphilus]